MIVEMQQYEAYIKNNDDVPYYLRYPWFMIGLLSAYLLFVNKIGPSLMKHRKPYKLKEFIIIYNIMQVLVCLYTVTEILNVTENKIMRFWQCQVVTLTKDRIIKYKTLTTLLFWLKVSELSETIVFVLRKKQNQVSLLHVFHHCSTVTLIYLMMNENKNGLSAFYPVFLNTNVHIIMYTYYLIAAVADKKTLRRLLPVKKSITIIQMIQFTMILAQAGVMWKQCGVPGVILAYYCVVVCAIFYGFYDFYKKSYTKARTHKQQQKHIAKSTGIF